MTDLGSIPQGLDEVSVSAADRVRLSSPNTVFVAGLEEGVFPAVIGQSGLFTLHERTLLREKGLELSFPEDLRASEERFITYSAVTAPRERLYLSWHRLDAAGGSYLPGETAFNEYVSQLIIAVIIYFAGFSKFIKDFLTKRSAKKAPLPPKAPERLDPDPEPVPATAEPAEAPAGGKEGEAK